VKSLIAYIDFKSPQAYLAFGAARDLARRHSLQVQWLPYDTRQPVIEAQREDETRGETHIRVRQIQRHRTCLLYAKGQGVPMRFPDQPMPTRCALSALLYAGASAEQFAGLAFAAYWDKGLELDDPAVVSRLLQQADCDPEGFQPDVWEENLQASILEAEGCGVFDTPLFLCEGQLFLGREQFPLLESLLD
jgi:2-hydroxychromene-2-carboxylate isomerase